MVFEKPSENLIGTKRDLSSPHAVLTDDMRYPEDPYRQLSPVF